jgi:hypothetical protein
MSESSVAKVERRRRVVGGRHHRHVVRVTPEEEALLLARALERNISVPKLLVESALSGGADAAALSASMRHELLPALFTEQRLLAGIANNVNQLARLGNSTGEVPAQLAGTLDAVRRTSSRIDGLIEQIAEELR